MYKRHGYICSAVTDFVVTFADDSDIVNLHGWSQGSFSGMSWSNVYISCVVVGITLALTFLLSKPIDVYKRQVIECPTMKTPPEELDLEAYYEKVHTDATDASLGENNEIIPAVTGISFDVKSAAKKLEKAKEGAKITIPLEITLPEVSTEEIEALPYRCV